MDAFGLDGLELATMDFVDPKARPAENLVAADADRQLGHFTLFVGLGAVQIGLEHVEEGFVFVFVVREHEADVDDGLLAFFQHHLGQGESHATVAGIEHINGVAVDIQHFFSARAVVVAVEDDVEAGHILRDPLGSIFPAQGCVFGQVLYLWLPAGVEETNHQVRAFLFLDDFYPFFGGGLQLLEAQTGPQSIGHPSDDVRREQPQHGNLEAVAFQYNIRSEIRLAGRFVDDIGANHGHFQLRIVLVEHLAACLDVVVADTHYIVREKVEHF